MVKIRQKKENSSYSASPQAKDILHLLKKTYSISDQELLSLLGEVQEKLSTKETFPLSIIHEKLTVLESVLKYLREEKNYSLHQCAETLKRNEKNLWHAYHNATQKVPTRIAVGNSSISVPLDIFSNETLSPQEALVFYLKEKEQMTLHTIAELLLRDDRTIWTAYTRAKQKTEIYIRSPKKEKTSEKSLEQKKIHSDKENIVLLLKKTFTVSDTELLKLLHEAQTKLSEKESFPISIIHEKLTVLESVLKYLREEKNYTLHHCANILGRNEKNLWHAYHNATQKVPTRIAVGDSSISVPLDIFSNETLSPQEALVFYLKETQQMTLHAIAELLFRDDRTIWTAYTRAKKKYENKK